MITKQNKIPSRSLLKQDEASFHYIDSFQSQAVVDGEQNDIQHIAKLLLSSGPAWIDTLMAIRDQLVKLVGLKTSDLHKAKQQELDELKFEPGEQLGIFKLYARSENELILGKDDKHLDFRVSLLLDRPNAETTQKKIAITTAVQFNNLFGRIYFVPVKPFHQLIVRRMLKELVRKARG
ncbi:DUF2867 domain-containing protein [Sunxiuqinia elliptica]